MTNTDMPGETLTMTRGLLEDFKRYAANQEREEIIENLRNLAASRSQINLIGIIALLQSGDV
jgi:hypothetical protein